MQQNSATLHSELNKKIPAHRFVYAQLRDQVLFGELAPGQAVTIQGIAEALDAGMTPVREALRRLISDGALNMAGNRRVTVPEITENCIEELDFMRKQIEPELAARATPKMTKDLLADLEGEDNALNTAINRGDVRAYLLHNYKFHARLYAAAEAPIMAATVDRLWFRFGPSLRVVCGRYGTFNLPDKHAELLDALKCNDPIGARKAIIEDVDQGMLQVREALRDKAEGHRFD
ncbi:MAG: GntR family transcriptional regulator [Roseobacter sp.]